MAGCRANARYSSAGARHGCSGGLPERQAESAALTVAAVPYRTLIPYFKGHVTDYLTSNAPVLAADYVVAYISQTQRKGPNIRLWEYLQHQTPEATLRLHGIDYAHIYRGPRFLSAAMPQTMRRGRSDFGGPSG